MAATTMRRLLIGFDSAWTAQRSGGLVAAVHETDGTFKSLGPPQLADFLEATERIAAWQAEVAPETTIVMLDQPTIVTNATGQRPVENLVAGPVSRRFGGVQPSNTSRLAMFGEHAPLWSFLHRFGGAADPLRPLVGTRVIETYPVLAMIALGWTRPGTRATGRLPKYNPERRSTFSLDDWQFVCRRVEEQCHHRGLADLQDWLGKAARLSRPQKADQDGLDACVCLLTAMHASEGRECLIVGDTTSGYMLCPAGDELQRELEDRCVVTGRVAAHCVRVARLVVGTV